MNLKDALKHYSDIMDSWAETPFDDLYKSCELMKDMSVIKDYLVRHKILYKKKWASKWHQYHIKESKSSTAAEKLASQDVPELDHLRQLIRSAYTNIEVMRSQVSLLKQEK